MAVEAVTVPTETNIDDNAWWEAVVPILEEVWSEERFPLLSSALMAKAWEQPVGENPYFLTEAMSSFEFGLARVFDGVELFVMRRAGEPDREPG